MNHEDFIGLISYLGCSFLHEQKSGGLVYCSHLDNPYSCEGNCNFSSCPLKKMLLDAKKGLDAYECVPRTNYLSEEQE